MEIIPSIDLTSEIELTYCKGSSRGNDNSCILLILILTRGSFPPFGRPLLVHMSYQKLPQTCQPSSPLRPHIPHLCNPGLPGVFPRPSRGLTLPYALDQRRHSAKCTFVSLSCNAATSSCLMKRFIYVVNMRFLPTNLFPRSKLLIIILQYLFN